MKGISSYGSKSYLLLIFTYATRYCYIEISYVYSIFTF